MKKFKVTITLLLLLFFISTAYGSDCDALRAKAEELEEKMNQTNSGEDTYNFGQFLATQIVENNECISKDVLYTFKTIFAQAVDLGHSKAGTRLALTNYYGLYATPINKKRAFDVARFTIANTEFSQIDVENHVWMNLVIFLDLAAKNGFEENSPPLKSFWNGIKSFNPTVSENAPNSEKRILRELNYIKRQAYTYGHYGETPNAEKALANAELNTISSMYRNYVHLHNERVAFNSAPNKAQELAMAICYAGFSAFHKDAKKYAIRKLNDLAGEFKDIASFKTSLKQPNGKWNTRVEKMMNEDFKGDIEKLYRSIATNENIEDHKGYKGWKYMPLKEKNELFSKAIDYDQKNMTHKERFSIFKAMVNNNERSAFYWLANAYHRGLGSYKQVDKAIIYYNKAIKSNKYSDKAYVGLAQVYDKDEDFQNWYKAVPFLEYCYENNLNLDLMVDYAEYMYMGIAGVDINKDKAIEIFETAAKAGSSRAKDHIAVAEALRDSKPRKIELEGKLMVLPLVSSYQSVFNLKEENIAFTYNVEVGTLDTNDLKVSLWVYRNNSKPNLQYTSYSPSSGTITKKGTYTAKVWPYNSGKGARAFGFFSVGISINEINKPLDDVPVVYYHMPKKN